MTGRGIIGGAVGALILALAASPAAADTQTGTWRAKFREEQVIFKNGSGAQMRIVLTVCIDPTNARSIALHRRTENSLGTPFDMTATQACHTHAMSLPTGTWLVVRPKQEVETEVTGTYQVSW